MVEADNQRRGARTANVTIDELLGLALVLGTSIGQLLNPVGHLPVPDFHTAIDPGGPDIPYLAPENPDDAWPKELPGTAGIGIPRDALRALPQGDLVLNLEWDDGHPTGINIKPFVIDLDKFMRIVNDVRRRGGDQEEGQHEGNDQEARRDVDVPVRRHAKRSPSDRQ